MRAGGDGMLGPAVYFAETPKETSGKALHTGKMVCLDLEAHSSQVAHIRGPQDFPPTRTQVPARAQGHIASHAPYGRGTARAPGRPEYAVYDTARAVPWKVGEDQIGHMRDEYCRDDSGALCLARDPCTGQPLDPAKLEPGCDPTPRRRSARRWSAGADKERRWFRDNVETGQASDSDVLKHMSSANPADMLAFALSTGLMEVATDRHGTRSLRFKQ